MFRWKGVLHADCTSRTRGSLSELQRTLFRLQRSLSPEGIVQRLGHALGVHEEARDEEGHAERVAREEVLTRLGLVHLVLQSSVIVIVFD